MKRKILVFLLALCLAAALVPVAAFAEEAQSANVWDGSVASAFAGGTGTAENPYQIATGAQLAYLASSVNSGETYAGKNFVLTADIDLNKRPWTPIANTLSVVFAGNLDGQGYTVSNVAIGSESAPLESNVFGLFGTTEGKISNLHLNTVSIHGIAMKVSGRVIGLAGGLIGSASGNVENCHVTGLTMTMTMTSDSNRIAAYWIGGLVGASDAKQINECSVVSGMITETSGKGSIGGLIGELGKASKITYSRADVTLNVTANPTGGADVGGFIGKGNGKSSPETVIRNCYATGAVTGGAYTGGFTGSISGLNIKNCYATGDVSKAFSSMASFAGNDGPSMPFYGSVINCYATGKVIGDAAYTYAFTMQQDGTPRSEITNCYFSDTNSSLLNKSATAKPLDEMKTDSFADVLNAGDKSNGWVFVNGEALGGAEPADYSAIEKALKTVPSDLTVYTDESVAALNKAIDGVIQGKAAVNQADVDAMAQAIEDAIAALQYKGADYSAVDAAIAKADKLNRDEYKDFSAVEAAVRAVVRDKPLSEQDDVDAMAKAIEDAIAALQYKGADYSKVDAAIAKADKLNRDEYKDFSAVEAAVRAVVRGKPLSEQAEVDAMAKAIEDAMAALEKKPVEMTVQLPQTGDDSNLALWTALLLVSGAAICTMMAGKKKNYGK